MAGAPGGRAAAVDPNRHDTVEDARRRGRVRARIGDAPVQGELTLLLRRNAGLAHDPTPARQIRLHPLCERVGSARFGQRSMAFKALDNFRIGQHLVESLIEALDG